MNKASVLIAVLLASVVPSAVLAQKAKKSSDKSTSSSHTAAVVNTTRNPEIEKNDPGNSVAAEPGSPTAVADTTSGESDELSLTSIYRVGPGDVLDIRLHNFTSGSSTLFTVLEDGAIDFPLLGGPVKVGSLTTAEIEKRLGGEFKRRVFLNTKNKPVNVRQCGSHTVIITGL